MTFIYHKPAPIYLLRFKEKLILVIPIFIRSLMIFFFILYIKNYVNVLQVPPSRLISILQYELPNNYLRDGYSINNSVTKRLILCTTYVSTIMCV